MTSLVGEIGQQGIQRKLREIIHEIEREVEAEEDIDSALSALQEQVSMVRIR